MNKLRVLDPMDLVADTSFKLYIESVRYDFMSPFLRLFDRSNSIHI